MSDKNNLTPSAWLDCIYIHDNEVNRLEFNVEWSFWSDENDEKQR